jgi:hypothetical protein
MARQNPTVTDALPCSGLRRLQRTFASAWHFF